MPTCHDLFSASAVKRARIMCSWIRNITAVHSVYITTDFEKWKADYEAQSCSWFVQGSGKKGPAGSETTYYYCNRSGYFHSEAVGKRHLKSQGSSKISAHCTAAVRVTRNTLNTRKSDETLHVTICHTHYGHSQALGHLRLPQADRLKIGGQLAQGVEFGRILDDIRDKVSGSFTRLHLVTRKDITNIERAFGLRGSEKHPNDAVSVSAWVEEMKVKGTDNPVLLYKPQGEQQGLCHNLNITDFVLVLQTQLQRQMLKSFGPNRVVCADATHGTNSYDFQLISLLVVDEFGEGFPVAWCLSNRTDQILLTHFFRRVKETSGVIIPAWFMSDDAEQLFNAWISVMGPGPRKLLCVWHVDRAWRFNLKLVNGKEAQATVYHTLRVLLEETDITKFEKLLKSAVEYFNQSETAEDFGKYFSQYYLQRKEEWASCYRKAATVNSNMYVESFHHVFKYMYLMGKVNKRVDKCVHTLLKFARDKAFERLVKLEKGKTTGRIQRIVNRHLASKELNVELVLESSDVNWTVTSSSGERKYCVTRETDKCPTNCSLRCSDCGICVHTYCCNCPDSLINNTICKHVHLVARFLQSKPSYEPNLDDPYTTVDGSPSVANDVGPRSDLILQEVQQKHKEFDLASLRERLQDKLAIISAQVLQCTSVAALQAAERHLSSIVGVIKALEINTTTGLTRICTSKEPSNKNITPQRKFVSTKRKRKLPTVRLSKPTFLEKEEVCNNLFNPKYTQSSFYNSMFTPKELRKVQGMYICNSSY